MSVRFLSPVRSMQAKSRCLKQGYVNIADWWKVLQYTAQNNTIIGITFAIPIFSSTRYYLYNVLLMLVSGVGECFQLVFINRQTT